MQSVQLGPRPFYLVENMDKSDLKAALQACAGTAPAAADADGGGWRRRATGAFEPSDFSIGHRGAALQFPEHTQESYEAAARMGAGILECDVTFTKDRAAGLPPFAVRSAHHHQHPRHPRAGGQVHASRSRRPIRPPASRPRPCAAPATSRSPSSRRLCGKMDAFNPNATTRRGVPGRHARLPHRPLRHLRHADDPRREHRAVQEPGRRSSRPSSRRPSVPMPFEGDYTQEHYAQQMIDEYKAAGVSPRGRLRPVVQPRRRALLDRATSRRSASRRSSSTTAYDDARPATDGGLVAGMRRARRAGREDHRAADVGAGHARRGRARSCPRPTPRPAKAAGLDIITWTLERSGPLNDGRRLLLPDRSPAPSTTTATCFTVLDVLAQQVGVRGIFSDWPATVTYYANCMGLK